jgi:hypothetical protein
MDTFECVLCGEPCSDRERIDVLYDDMGMSIDPFCFESLGGAAGVEEVLHDWRPRHA